MLCRALVATASTARANTPCGSATARVVRSARRLRTSGRGSYYCSVLGVVGRLVVVGQVGREAANPRLSGIDEAGRGAVAHLA